jgi:hypothetical protein
MDNTTQEQAAREQQAAQEAVDRVVVGDCLHGRLVALLEVSLPTLERMQAAAQRLQDGQDATPEVMLANAALRTALSLRGPRGEAEGGR